MVDAGAFGYPVRTLSDLKPGDYWVQALLHRYETFKRSDGHTVKLPMDRGEGQQWNRAPGNLYSTPQKITVRAGDDRTIKIHARQSNSTDRAAERHEVHQARQRWRASCFRNSGAGQCISAPTFCCLKVSTRIQTLAIRLSSSTVTSLPLWRLSRNASRSESETGIQRSLQAPGLQQDRAGAAHKFYQEWTGPNFPRMIIIEIQHANPYYDDSYAVNSANLGPYGDAITYELVPFIEKQVSRHRQRLGALHVWRFNRRMGSTGGADFLSG